VETANDVLEELGNFDILAKPAEELPKNLEDPVLTALGHAPCSLDDLVEFTGQSADQLLPELLMLELSGQIATLPGNRYQRLS
jgi:DNA processing protein